MHIPRMASSSEHEPETCWCTASDSVVAGQGPPAPGECPVMNLGFGSPKRPIGAILVFKDPGDWYLDLQIMTDVILGGRSPPLRIRDACTDAALSLMLTARHIHCCSSYAEHARQYRVQYLQRPS